ncbi:MAG: hypothetical protein NTZ17_15240 [Phycisphaerae bacterium]|nr:hypothetical protein [Phycisphaerae bacterium]
MARKCIGLPLGGMIALCAILLLAPDTRGQMTITKKKYVISGTVGLAGVTMNGLPAPVMTDQNGTYSAEVEHGWSGIVTPALNGYKFEPRNIQYPKVVGPLSDQNYKPTLITYTISGSVMLPDVKMVGFPDEVTSDASGRYTATVSMNWSGKVTPQKTAFQFDPASRSYNQVARDMKDENYKGSEQVIVISGSAGVQGAVLKGLPGSPVAGPKGVYRAEVQYGASVKVTPTLDGHAFIPPEMEYLSLTENQANQNYTASVFNYQISGTAGMAGVVMNGLPGNPLTDGNGFYTATVEHGWSGKVTPEKPGHTFTPPSITVTKVTAPKENQDFKGQVISYKISGSVGAPGVKMSGIPGEPVSSEKGLYSAQVEYGWSGIVTPTKEGFNFTPPSKDYSAVIQDQTQNYTAQAITFKVSGNVGGLPQVILKGFPPTAVVVTGPDGSYTVDVPYNWKGTVVPQKPGFSFDPNSKTYDGVLFPQVNQDYTPKIMQCTLSGQVVDETSAGVEGVLVQGDNNAGSVTTDATGKFGLQVNYGWNGRLTFQKGGYTFNPSTKPFSAVATDVRNLTVAAKTIMLTIADRITAGAEPIAEVKITATPGGATTVTDTTGAYRIQVPYGWTGELKFEKEGFEFSFDSGRGSAPDTKAFTNVTEDVDALNPKPVTPTPQATPPVQTPSVQTPAPQPAPSTAEQQIRQQIAQLMTDQTNLTNLINSNMQRGTPVSAEMTQRLNEISQQIANSTLQLNQLRAGQATTPGTTAPSAEGLQTVPPGGKLPPAGPPTGPLMPQIDGRPKLHDVLTDLARKNDVKIEWDLTVKNDSVPVGLSEVEKLHVAQALQEIVTSIKPPYACKVKASDDKTYEVFRPISNAFPGTRLDSALQDVATTAGVPIVVDPNVTGDVFVSFENVSLDVALELMLAGKPYVFKKTPRYYLVAGRSVTSQAFPEISETRRVRLNYIQPGRAKALLSSVFAPYVQAELPNTRDPNDEGNMLLVTAAPAIADRIIEDLKMIDRYKRQVLLDARVVVMEKGNLLNLGAEWSWPTLQAGVFTSQGVTNSTTGTTSSGWPYGVQIGYAPDQTFTNSLMMALNLLQQNSQADIIANPKVVAQDGRQAEMRVVEEQWFMMQAAQTMYTYSQAQLQKIESGTVLIITPYIGDNNDITLQMAVEVSDSIPKARGSDLPRVTRRMAKNSVTVKDGGTVAVGGLTENRSKMEEKRVPGLSSIPLLGELFKNKNNDKSSREVAVFVTAHLVPEGTQTASLPAQPNTIATVEQPAGDEYTSQIRNVLVNQK